ncbi:hypothetical protein FA13DRAFT_788397 [Coprinellus micaceus]|uniref:Uncharacterized protein n=1 Tax=Coprinellus micaceus TaxID=71717 RepID=A0A4Y7S8B7_COPMI|nr:hypothetical protein FA13DRAFT_788397 [Coprinellus micaceus]
MDPEEGVGGLGECGGLEEGFVPRYTLCLQAKALVTGCTSQRGTESAASMSALPLSWTLSIVRDSSLGSSRLYPPVLDHVCPRRIQPGRSESTDPRPSYSPLTSGTTREIASVSCSSNPTTRGPYSLLRIDADPAQRRAALFHPRDTKHLDSFQRGGAPPVGFCVVRGVYPSASPSVTLWVLPPFATPRCCSHSSFPTSFPYPPFHRSLLITPIVH